MLLPVPFRFLAVFLLVLPGSSLALGGPEGPTTHSTPAPSSIVVGFVGGLVRHDNPKHGPVQLAQRIRSTSSKDTYVEVFENRHRSSAFKTVLRLLDLNRDGILSEEEKSHSRIILYGHSWGAAAAVLLARDLKREHIPVLLTVQVDSVAKLWQNDAIIPDNVTEAANFYQPHGLLHGRSQIKAADPERTQILGNYLTDYSKVRVDCTAGLSWYDRYLTPGHAQSECDPNVWGKVEDLIRQRLTPPVDTASSHPEQPATQQ